MQQQTMHLWTKDEIPKRVKLLPQWAQARKLDLARFADLINASGHVLRKAGL
ncbi:hypothetical protein [Bradyrhizobium sp. USDA 4529]